MSLKQANQTYIGWAALYSVGVYSYEKGEDPPPFVGVSSH